MCLSNPVCDTSQPLTDDTFSVLKTQMKLFTFFFENKELHLKSFFAQSYFRDKASQALTLFYLVMYTCKEPRYNTATKN